MIIAKNYLPVVRKEKAGCAAAHRPVEYSAAFLLKVCKSLRVMRQPG
jgi:hypothetical protein